MDEEKYKFMVKVYNTYDKVTLDYFCNDYNIDEENRIVKLHEKISDDPAVLIILSRDDRVIIEDMGQLDLEEIEDEIMDIGADEEIEDEENNTLFQ